MVRLNSILTAVFLAAMLLNGAAAEVLSVQSLNAIIGKPHSAKVLEPALRVYPAAREYEITITNTVPDGRSASGKITAFEKWVDGRYIVSEAQPAGQKTKFQMVVEYDAPSKTYRKYLVMAGKLIGYQVGTRVGDSRSIAWLDLTEAKFASDVDCISTETHTDDSTSWTALFFQKGTLLRTETGVAKVTKPVTGK